MGFRNKRAAAGLGPSGLKPTSVFALTLREMDQVKADLSFSPDTERNGSG